MRELRFRAWVYYGERLKKPHYSRDYDGLDRFFEDHSENDNKQCIEQFVGIKDKNGDEVYEGDIVKYRCPECGKEVIGDMEWRTGKTKFVCKTDGVCVRHNKVELWDDEFEIIGNIHENPELLGERIDGRSEE